jgi:hypothetical protein
VSRAERALIAGIVPPPSGPTADLDTAPLSTASESLFAVRPTGAAVPSSTGWYRLGRVAAGQPAKLWGAAKDLCPVR